MAKMTIQEELDTLRKEVEELKKQKEIKEQEESIKEIEKAELKSEESAQIEQKAEEIIDSLKKGKTDAKEALDQMVDTIKKDYENLSPVSAVVLFALGVAFGNAISSK